VAEGDVNVLSDIGVFAVCAQLDVGKSRKRRTPTTGQCDYEHASRACCFSRTQDVGRFAARADKHDGITGVEKRRDLMLENAPIPVVVRACRNGREACRDVNRANASGPAPVSRQMLRSGRAAPIAGNSHPSPGRSKALKNAD